ncbi:MAG: DUF5916 domain-containing protein [Gemmatimonadaceae bacterium]
MPNVRSISAVSTPRTTQIRWIVASLAAGSLLAPLVLRSQQVANVHAAPAESAVAAKRLSAVSIDGKLDDAAWRAATPITSFRQFQPTEGAAPSMATEIRILYDAQALYIGARMHDPEGARGIRAPLARRDQLLDDSGNNGGFNSLTSDKLIVVLDPYHNHLDEAVFEINPLGVRGDSFNGDDSWDPIWEAAARVDSAGWTAEMRIPYSQLRFSRGESQTWGMQLWRYIDRLNERDMWAFWRRNANGGASFFNHLSGLTIADRPRQVELLPYVVSRGQYRPVAPGDPFHSNSDMRLNVGADMKYLLTSNLTLDATINPDFGQVEVDPASLNLSAYETFYDEKRPFFVAGNSAFSFGGSSCFFCSNTSSLGVFYSRRIGRPPQLGGYLDSRAAYADTPDNATILGAAKITGRTSNGYTIGFLDAVTNRETARYITSTGGATAEQTVEPLSNYLVARVKKDLRNGATTVGAIVTSAVRRLGDDSVLTNRLRSHATAVGIDWNHTWHQRDYQWRTTIVTSDIGGSAGAIGASQRSSARYFQRPDREVTDDGLFSTRYDTLATSLRGYGFYSRLARQNGNWRWETAQSWRSPGFETNDLSFLDRSDYKWMNANIARVWNQPTTWYRSIFTSLGGQQQFNYDGIRNDLQGQYFLGLELPNYWNIRTFYIYHPTVYDDRLTRGGPVVKRTGYTFSHAQVSTDARRRVVFDLSVETDRGLDEPTKGLTIQPGVAFKPAASVFVQLSPSYNVDEASAQYVRAVSDPTATLFSGNRYVFALTKTRALSLDTRVNWTFTPDLTLQLFAQPFFASGAYSHFREFAAPRTLKKLEYGRDVGTIIRTTTTSNPNGLYTVDPDGSGPASAFAFGDPNFSDRSLRGTAVLRWEYRPGSTIFLAWTQQRFGSDGFGDFDFGRDRAALLHDKPDNVFVVKMNYWLGR